ncbi:DNA polymerase III subunit delta [Serratia sp. UGAL515B_01]|uniref:DNA polymerase III subunit delta n=1 Tax=Serratia sp. UGAL515B_01 TaxID=2986763 RepID=UPI0029555DF3|nr:DNA polymerase III subunit delta [Serratia sp. UGAL515B_01]WON76102.1 DNA polymerase III subunit delta [Serratia sp. UGAL515B_01]
MIRIYPEQLAAQLREGVRACYILSGNEPLLLQESQDMIRQVAQQQAFTEHYSVSLDAQTDWDVIFNLCQAMSLFASRQTLLLIFPENGPTAPIGEQLVKLAGLLHEDILLVLRGPRLTKAQENSAWFKALGPKGVLISCQTPEQAQLPRWVAQRAKAMQLYLDDAANQVLCYCYEGNLLALSQALERLALLHPDGKLTLPRVEQAVNDAAHFTPFHWMDALLAGKSQRAWHILQQLQQEDAEPVILLRTLQRELLMLLTLRRKMANTPLRTLFDQQKVWQNRRELLTQALQRLTELQLRQAIRLLTQIEITLKKDYGQTVWPQLEALSMLLCGKKLAKSFTDAR